jgi:hypothetical protein
LAYRHILETPPDGAHKPGIIIKTVLVFFGEVEYFPPNPTLPLLYPSIEGIHG